MAKTIRKARVEDFKVPKENKVFARTYRKMKQIGEMLKNDAFGAMLRARGARDAHADWLEEFQGMVKNAPPEKIKELAQQLEEPAIGPSGIGAGEEEGEVE